MAAATNYQELAGIRFALGIAEAGFAPGVAFYLSSWYKRYELATRFSIYYTATAVSGAFSGLLAGLITQHLDGARGLQGWQWLFVSRRAHRDDWVETDTVYRSSRVSARPSSVSSPGSSCLTGRPRPSGSPPRSASLRLSVSPTTVSPTLRVPKARLASGRLSRWSSVTGAPGASLSS
jgi:MFS family permease